LGIVIALRYRKTSEDKEIARETAPAEGLTYRWKYIMLPLAVLALSIALAAYFYHLLPVEVAFRFSADGLPENWLSRQAFTGLMLGAQFLLVFLGGAVTLGIVKLGRSLEQADKARVGRVVLAMGNMVALIQIVLAFVMVDIFSYNIYGSHLMSIWLFGLIVMALGGIALILFFIPAIRRSGAGGVIKAMRSDLFDRTKNG
jgi:uncharacterized membrane protein